MKNSRLGISSDDAYLLSLGLAAFVFSRLEWDAVWCCQQLQPGYIPKLGKRTAGCIASDLVRLISEISDPQLRETCRAPAERFKQLVITRNRLVHARPFTDSDDEQRLSYDYSTWTIEMIDEAATEFAACSLNLNRLIHNELKSYAPDRGG